MAKSIFEKMGGRYEKQGDYMLCCFPFFRMVTVLGECYEISIYGK